MNFLKNTFQVPYSTLNNGVRLYGQHAHTSEDCRDPHREARYDGRHMLHLRIMAHQSQNLANVLSSWLSKPREALTHRQKWWIRELERIMHDTPAADPATFSQDKIREYFKAVDKIFFDGTLAEHVGLDVLAGPLGEQGDAGHTRYSRRGKPRVRMEVYDFRDWRGKRSPEERRAKVLTVLIHEGIHAFFLVHGCEGRGCATWEAIEQHEGFTGHGPDFRRCNNAAVGFVVRHMRAVFQDAYNPRHWLMERFPGMEQDMALQLRIQYKP